MSQVSKRLIEKEVSKKIPQLLIETITDCKNRDHSQKFLDDFLTATEKIMLGKRLAIAVLLLKDYDYRSISDILKVSITTIGRISNLLKLEESGVRMMAERHIDKEKWDDFLSNLSKTFIKLNRPFRHIPEKPKPYL